MTVGLNIGGGLTITPNGLEFGIPIGSGLAIAITNNNDPSTNPSQHASTSTSAKIFSPIKSIASVGAQTRGSTAAKITTIGCIVLGSACLARLVQSSLTDRAGAWGATSTQAKWAGILGGVLTVGAGLGAAAFVWNKF